MFESCCADCLPGTGDIGKTFSSHWRAGNFDLVLKAARADVTQYTIWHKSHTVPLAHIGNPTLLNMWDIDVEALFDYVERLMTVHMELGRLDEFPAVLERLRKNIQTDRWQQKIVHLQALCALGKNWDEEKGYREIIKLGPINSISDKRILPFYLNLSGDRLSLAERLKLIDQVMETTDDETTLLHQTLVKGTLLLMHNDLKGAVCAIENVVQLSENLTEPDSFQKLKHAQALFVLASISLDSKQDPEVSRDYLHRSTDLFQELLTDTDLTAIGRAALLSELSGNYRLQSDWEKALGHLRSASEIHGVPIFKVFEARCLSELDGLSEALNIIDELSMDSFSDDEEKADYIWNFGLLAIASGDTKRLARAKNLLEMPLKRGPIFYQQSLRTTTLVLEAMHSGNSQSLTNRARGALRSGLSGLNSYIIFKPNFFGIGFDVNQVIDDATRKHEERE